ncbi:lipopolysaccharide biosynthesis protein [Subtercola frigoramans]|uniref:O-antigen/teichoic acid export membrane protein n=1 Tax=Subtercola frigoramans TaxID=120298 RepID=A0ABS2L883_9MICO|nr:hypothetical protein [Subtercola frigoramans]MBM7473298.1 O-antigen/teichoic acid export membrane protein [Subtercola frigoramans]
MPRAAALRTLVVGLAAVIAGFGSYVLLIFVSQGTSTADYADFAVFWSLTVTVGLGFFYPVEQETARSIAGVSDGRGGLVRFVFLCAFVIAVATGLVALLLLTPAAGGYLGSGGLVLALVLSFFGYAVQFPVRGMMSGSRRTTSYSAIIALEGALRVVLPAIILAAGIAGSFSFALVVPVAAAVSVLPAVLSRDRSWLAFDRIRTGLYAGRLARLIVAALSIQLILNSGTLIARFVGGESGAALTGQILVCITIARIPVFGYQVLQILYLPRLAREWQLHQLSAARRTVLVAVGVSVAAGVAIVVGMVLLGPWVIGLLFGADRVLSEGGIALVSLGVAVFLIALIMSDGTLAMGRHTVVIRSWVIAAAAAVAPVLVIADPLLRVTSPLIVGSSVALIQLGASMVQAMKSERDVTSRDAVTS